MGVILEILTDTTPLYFTDEVKANIHHNTHGGFAWKRKEGQPEAYKPYAHGILPVSRLAIYDLWQVNGRRPTPEDIEEATRLCYAQRDQSFSSISENGV